MVSKPCDDSVIFSAFGKRYYAFIVAPSRVVIYRVSTKAIVFDKILTNRQETLTRRFTSLINFENGFYAGLSDGTIFSFIKGKKAKSKFKLISSKREKLGAYNNFEQDTSHRAITLLGCNADVLVYQTKNHEIVLLRQSNKPYTFPFKEPICKLIIDDKFKMLTFATQNEDSVFIHSIMYDCLQKESNEFKIPEHFELVDLSKSGVIACHDEGDFIIWNPFADPMPEPFSIGTPDSLPQFTCFAGELEEYFAYSDSKYPEIGIAAGELCAENGQEEWERHKFAQHDMMQDWKVSKDHNLQWEDNKSNTTIRDIQSDGKNLIIRVQGRPHEHRNKPMKECLLIFDLSKNDASEHLSCTDYIPLDFRA
ncbi:hypothetical protein COCVIDRAFT_21097 [Bipolaris victoriae FI3]|uniref:Uncharacterized protein n=1 Tax=Bipolaris victoriae (strain FI3) TaxID=930091 RepID=W7E9Z4_BIPV3|nr:hypothetical protein COCVIDRAFT_21097 [Bipolaris victoriae FI3]